VFSATLAFILAETGFHSSEKFRYLVGLRFILRNIRWENWSFS